jgi:hypothetical protein
MLLVEGSIAFENDNAVRLAEVKNAKFGYSKTTDSLWLMSDVGDLELDDGIFCLLDDLIGFDELECDVYFDVLYFKENGDIAIVDINIQ